MSNSGAPERAARQDTGISSENPASGDRVERSRPGKVEGAGRRPPPKSYPGEPVECPADRGSRSTRRQAFQGTGSIVPGPRRQRSEEHTSELQSLMRISYAVFCLKKQNTLGSTLRLLNSRTKRTA